MRKNEEYRDDVVVLTCECGRIYYYYIEITETFPLWRDPCDGCRKILYTQDEIDLFEVLGYYPPDELCAEK